MPRFWLAVACRDHVRIGRAGGFMQVCHGKAAPLRRLSPGDGIVYYSPTERLGDRLPLRCFTALGRILPGTPYQADMGGGFLPYRRDVAWEAAAADVPVGRLVDQLDLTRDRRGWGYQLRFGLIGLSEADMQRLEGAMLGHETKNRPEDDASAGFRNLVAEGGFEPPTLGL